MKQSTAAFAAPVSFTGLGEVKVTDGYCARAMEKEVAYLLKLDVRKLLYYFYVNAGLAPDAPSSYQGGWEGALIGGHTLGHYMVALAQAYANANTSEPSRAELKARITYLAAELKRCQDNAVTAGAKAGFLWGAAPAPADRDNKEAQFDFVERGRADIAAEAWVPWYTMHKIVAGLVALAVYAGDGTAKEVAAAMEYKVPLLMTKKATSAFMAEIIRWLNVKLAPCISVHGVLVDIYGAGVLITGESGIGKSEAALEPIQRGHRLVADDAVEIRKVSDDTLVGSAPDITKHFIELRGIGIVDVKTLFGVSNVKDTQNIDLVICLEDWDKEKEYDRLGLEEEYTEYLGNKVVCHNIPIRPGRNLAIICESAAINHRQKKMGYNAAQELYRRVQESLAKRRDEDEDDL